ncbi:MAG: CoA transferase [Dehalobacter sp. 4CP]|nr:CoA transferase [Dehalobacter sp. 4CP]
MKPLEGIRVLDLSRVLAGPYCTMLLADMGAEIVKIERPGEGDDARAFSPFIGEESAYFMSINRGKKSVVLDFKKEEDMKIFWELIKESDIIVENFRPGTMEKLGMGYEDIKLANPKIIYAGISGFGHTGPYSKRAAYDMLAQAMSGLMSITGEPGGPPVRVGTSIGDITAALFGTIGILLALNVRNKTGLGQKVDVAMLDSQVAILENAIARYEVTGKVPGPIGTRHPSIAPFQGFPTKDYYVIIPCGNDALWEKFCRVLGMDDFRNDPRFKTNKDRIEHVDELEEIIASITKTKTTDQWVDLLNEAGHPVGVINTVDKVVNDPQINARDMIVELEHSKAGKIRVAGNPIKLSLTPGEVSKPSPILGEHTREILKNVLGWSEERINKHMK